MEEPFRFLPSQIYIIMYAGWLLSLTKAQGSGKKCLGMHLTAERDILVQIGQ